MGIVIDWADPHAIEAAYASGRIIGSPSEGDRYRRIQANFDHRVGFRNTDDFHAMVDFHQDESKVVLLCTPIQKYHPKWGGHDPQEIGDCTSHGEANACMAVQYTEFEIGSNANVKRDVNEGPSEILCTEPHYRTRGHSGDGSAVSQQAGWIANSGGVLPRGKYGSVDLSRYNPGWARGNGVPDEILQLCKRNPVENLIRVRTTKEAASAILNGHALNVGSNQGFSRNRDKNGIAAPSGSWSHAMAWIGVDTTFKRSKGLLFLVQNSWGPSWNSGGVFPETQPPGSFWIEEAVAARMLRGDAIAHAGIVGFKPRDLESYGFEFAV